MLEIDIWSLRDLRSMVATGDTLIDHD